jgi:hypothetical protein
MGSTNKARREHSDELFAPKQLVVVLTHPFEKNDYLRQVKLRLDRKHSLYLFESVNSAFISSEISRFQAGALFFCVRNERDFEMVKQTLGELKRYIEEKALHPIGVCDLDDAAAHETLVKMGASVFPLSLEWKDLEKKIDSTCEVLRAQYPESVQTNLPLTRELKMSMRAPNTGNDHEIEVSPMEFGEGELLLDVESGAFSTGQEVLLTMNTGLPGLLTKVTAVTKTEGGRDVVSVLLSPELQVLVTSIKAAQVKAQAQVVNFLKDARGW